MLRLIGGAATLNIIDNALLEIASAIGHCAGEGLVRLPLGRGAGGRLLEHPVNLLEGKA